MQREKKLRMNPAASNRRHRRRAISMFNTFLEPVQTEAKCKISTSLIYSDAALLINAIDSTADADIVAHCWELSSSSWLLSNYTEWSGNSMPHLRSHHIHHIIWKLLRDGSCCKCGTHNSPNLNSLWSSQALWVIIMTHDRLLISVGHEYSCTFHVIES